MEVSYPDLRPARSSAETPRASLQGMLQDAGGSRPKGYGAPRRQVCPATFPIRGKKDPKEVSDQAEPEEERAAAPHTHRVLPEWAKEAPLE